MGGGLTFVLLSLTSDTEPRDRCPVIPVLMYQIRRMRQISVLDFGTGQKLKFRHILRILSEFTLLSYSYT